jgi:hypothetical protein
MDERKALQHAVNQQHADKQAAYILITLAKFEAQKLNVPPTWFIKSVKANAPHAERLL